MRVLFAAYAVSPRRGSEPGDSWAVASAIAEQGIDVTLLTSDRFEDDVENASIPDNLRIVRVPEPHLPRLVQGQLAVYWRYVAWQQASLTRARELCGRTQYDLVHHYSWSQLAFGTPLTRLGLPLVFGPAAGATLIDPELRQYLPKHQVPFERVRRVAIALARFNPRVRSVTRRATMVLAANSDAARLLARLRKATVPVMMHGVTPSAFLGPVGDRGSRAGDEGLTLLWLGRLMPRKGITLALDVLAELSSDICLLVVGDGPDAARAQDHMRDLGLGDRVRFLGVLGRDEVSKKLDEVDGLLFTSLRDSFGMQVLEAGARGTPIFGLEQHGVADFVPRSTGHLQPVEQPAEMIRNLATGIERTLRDPAAFANATSSARRFAEDYTAETVARRFIDLYSAIALTG